MRICAIFLLLGMAAMCLAAQEAEHIVSGTVTKVDHAAKTVTVKTAAGTEETVKYTENTSVKGAEGAAKATTDAVEEGDQLVVHYSVVAGQKTALEMKSTGKASAKVVQGTVVGIDKAGKTVTVQAADGTKETYHLAEDGVLETAKAGGASGKATAGGLAKGSKVTVHYTDKAGKKIAHGFERIF